jgi:hypothetical protein
VSDARQKKGANSFYLCALPPLHADGDKHDMLKEARALGKVQIADHEVDGDDNLTESDGGQVSTDLYRVDHDTLGKIDKAMTGHERKRVWLADGRGVQAYVRKEADAAADTEPGGLAPHSED